VAGTRGCWSGQEAHHSGAGEHGSPPNPKPPNPQTTLLAETMMKQMKEMNQANLTTMLTAFELRTCQAILHTFLAFLI
jgi:hypothetical protein